MPKMPKNQRCQKGPTCQKVENVRGERGANVKEKTINAKKAKRPRKQKNAKI